MFTLALSPSAGLGPLRQIGPMLGSMMPGVPRLLTIVAWASYLGPLALAGGIAAAILLPLALPSVDGLSMLAAGLILAVLVMVTRTVALIRLFRAIMVNPLVSALMRAALAPAPADQAESPEPS